MLSLGSTCATAGLWVITGSSPLVTPVRSVWLDQFHRPIKVLAIFAGWHPLINSVQTSGFFKTPDPVLKRKPSDGYRKTGKGGALLDSKATSFKFLSIQQPPREKYRRVAVEHMSGEGIEQYLISISLVWSYCFLKAQRATETVKVIFIAQLIIAEVDLTKSPNTFERVSYGPETCSVREKKRQH